MEKEQRVVVFYRKSSGHCPVEEFLDHFPGKIAQRIVWVLQLAQDLPRVPAQYFCKMSGTQNLWEFRIKVGAGSYRVLAFWDGPKIVLTHGFMKKTDKTPLQEIARAEGYRKDHYERKEYERS